MAVIATKTNDCVAEQELQLMHIVCGLQPRRPHADQAVFPGLPAPAAEVACARPLEVCIVTPDIVGPIRNGGIGTAYRYAAELLVTGGHRVTILYALGRRSENGPIERWIDEYARLGITLVPLPDPDVPNAKEYVGDAMSRTYAIYEWLKKRDFDLVHVSEWRGIGYYSLVSKHLGIAFDRTLFCVKTSSPTLWNMEGNAQLVSDPQTLIIAYMERKSVELADVVVSGSAYMLRWMLANGYRLPEGRSFVQPNIMPRVAAVAEAGATQELRQVNELVFFGRLEPRKGLHLFCDALNRLDASTLKPFKVTFLGKPAARFGSVKYIEECAGNWRFEWQIISDLDQPGALRYLSESGRAAVMPSVLDNSPFGVYECLSHRIPFICSNVGGAQELIHEDDRDNVLSNLHPLAQSALIERVLRHGLAVARPSYDLDMNNRVWLNWHHSLANGMLQTQLREARGLLKPRSIEPRDRPLVSVCIPHHERPACLEQALASLDAQSYRPFEVVVVDDGSRSPEAFACLERLEKKFLDRGWKLLRQKNLYAAAARNAAARHAYGKYLYFLDDDNVAKPEALEILVSTAERTGADVLTSFADIFSGDVAPTAATIPEARLTLVGDNVAFGVIANGFGDTHSLVRKTAFDALGGFREEYGVGKEDMEFFARAVLKGYRLFHVPEALYWYRRSPSRIGHRHYREYSGEYRVARAYLDASPHCFHPLFLLVQGLVQANSFSEKATKLLPAGNAGSTWELRWMREAGAALATKPLLYGLAYRLLQLEMNLWSRLLRWQILAGSMILRMLSRRRKG